jgi:hypothetical protein
MENPDSPWLIFAIIVGPLLIIGVNVLIDMIGKITEDGFGSDCYGDRPDLGELILVFLFVGLPIIAGFHIYNNQIPEKEKPHVLIVRDAALWKKPVAQPKH